MDIIHQLPYSRPGKGKKTYRLILFFLIIIIDVIHGCGRTIKMAIKGGIGLT
jgi:hypothetical protein